jgi:hypothetical protein
MMNLLIQPQVQEFIFNHEKDDEKALVLKHKTILGLPASAIAEQIGARKKAKLKLPLYYNTAGIIYPPGLNLEQSSSEKTAQFKSEILSSLPKHNSIVDLTGGFGIDTFFFSQIFQNVFHVEPNETLQKIAEHNHSVLNAKNIVYHSGTAESFLKTNSDKIDCVFIDPSRRAEGKKVFRLNDCEPNVSQLLPVIFTKTNYVLIKTSPLLDIQQGIQDLQGVKKIWVVAVENECKELLFLCHNGFSEEPEIIAVNLQEIPERFSFLNSEEKNTEPEFSAPLLYIYEPNAAILKAGAFKLISKNFNVFKLHPSTHLYTSNTLIETFSGRIFKNLQSVNSKSLKETFPEGKANVITRNYPLRPEELKKKLKLKDGGDRYVIAFSGQKEKYTIAASRIK